MLVQPHIQVQAEGYTETVRKQIPRHTMWYNAWHSPKTLIYAAFLIVSLTLSSTVASSVKAKIRDFFSPIR